MDQLRTELSTAGSRLASARAGAGVAIVAALALGMAGCGDAAHVPKTGGSPEAGVGSALATDASLEDALHRFRDGLPMPTSLSGGERSVDALIRRFVAALERSDTADVRMILMNRAEFAYLYYPTSPYAERQAAGLWWFLNIENSGKGITRAFERLGGRPLRYLSHECQPGVPDGPNVTHDRCKVTVRLGADTLSLRLFGSIMERDGAFKFMGYGNDF